MESHYKFYTAPPGETTLYKDIIVLWDEDVDTRILVWIDMLPEDLIKHVFAVAEHEGHIKIWLNDTHDDTLNVALYNTFNREYDVFEDHWSSTVVFDTNVWW